VRLTDKVRAVEGRVYPGRIGALVAESEIPAIYVDVARSTADPELFDEQDSTIQRTFVGELTVVHRGPDADLAADSLAAADLVDELAEDAEAALAREDVLAGALGLNVVEWRFHDDVLVLKDASLPLAHLTIRFTCTVVCADGGSVL
jgi:acyl carrier protein